MAQFFFFFLNKRYDSVWETLRDSSLPVVLYGTGNGADKVLDELEKLGVAVSAVFAGDGFVRNRTFRGHRVQSYSDVCEMFDDFIIAQAFGTSLPEVMDNIARISHEHKLLVPCVPVCGSEILNRDFVETHFEDLNRAYEALEDDQSRKVFEGAVKFQFTGEIEYLHSITSEKKQAFDDILRLGHRECYVDLGAYKGDTVEEFLAFSGGKYEKIIAAEPNKKSFIKLKEFCEKLDNACAYNCAVSDRSGESVLDISSGRGAHMSDKGQITQCKTVDDICQGLAPTYLKMDIEGAESKALSGGRETIAKYKPKLNIACYHKCRDIFELVLLIKSIRSDYKVYLRKHPSIPCWDMNLYCV